MKIKNVIIKSIIGGLFILSSCNKQNDKEFYSSGNIKLERVYNEDGTPKKIIEYYDSTNGKILKDFYYKKGYDSAIYYYNNGKIFKLGRSKNGAAFGKWNYYTREGYLSCTKEFFNINNSFDKGNRLNQIWYFNQRGDTMYYGNNKFNIYNQKEFESQSKGEKTSIFIRFFYYPTSDTVSIAEPLRCIAEDGYPFWEKRNSESYVVLAKEKFNFNKDFSNEKKVKLDTFYCIEKDKVNKSSMPEVNQKHTVAFGRWFDTPGKKVLRGYMVEHYKRKATPDDSIVGEKRRTYFEKVIYVKDTLK